MIRAAIYARISSHQDGRGLGVERQVEDCRKLAQSRGWSVGDEYVDNDVSGFQGIGDRPTTACLTMCARVLSTRLSSTTLTAWPSYGPRRPFGLIACESNGARVNSFAVMRPARHASNIATSGLTNSARSMPNSTCDSPPGEPPRLPPAV